MRNRILDHIVGIVTFLPLLIASLFKARGNKYGLPDVCPYDSTQPCEHADGSRCRATLGELVDCPLEPNEIMAVFRKAVRRGEHDRL